MGTTTYSTESIRQAQTTPLRVDRENSVVHGVRVCGPESKNRRRYPAAVFESAHGKYAGVPVNVDHHKPGTDVPAHSRFGRLINPRVVNGGITCDLQYNPKHPFAEPFVWACENNPHLYGLSHVARVGWRHDSNGSTAESIDEVASVDIVADPATTKTVFESHNRRGKTTMENYETPMDEDQSTGAVPPPDDAAVAGTPDWASIGQSIESKEDLIEGLGELMHNLKAGLFPPAEIDDVLAKVSEALGGAVAGAAEDAVEPDGDEAGVIDPDGDEEDQNEYESFMRRLRVYGPTGRRAARIVKYVSESKAKAKRIGAARKAIREAGLAAANVSEVFIETVAESINNPTKLAKLIDDRKAITRNSQPKTSRRTEMTTESARSGEYTPDDAIKEMPRK